jgi:hypothetical protein
MPHQHHNTGGKLTTGVVDKGVQFTVSVNNTGGHIFPEIYFDLAVTPAATCYQCQ